VGGVGVAIYVGNYVSTQHQIDKAPQRAFEHGHVPAIIKEHTPFIPRDKEESNLSVFIQESTVRGKYVVMIGGIYFQHSLPLSYLPYNSMAVGKPH
jgi:hypothetical protein